MTADARTSVLFVRMSQGERDTLSKLAASRGVSASELVRQMVRREAGQGSMLRALAHEDGLDRDPHVHTRETLPPPEEERCEIHEGCTVSRPHPSHKDHCICITRKLSTCPIHGEE